MKNLNHGSHIKNSKLRGEWAEMRFMARAAEHGLMVSKPWGDSAPYDFMVERHGRVLRIQVKCTRCQHHKGYKCHIDSNGVAYRPDQLDFIAAYIITVDAWFIIPVPATHGQLELLLTPHRKNSRYARYQEAWHLLL